MQDMTSYERAVSFRGKNIVVSASAGCGKTTTMIRRITDIILREEAEIDKMLVITFTRAAALEMKLKAKAALTKHADNPFVARQLDKLELSDISTIHSFCSKVCKEFFNVAGISPAFSLMDDTESSLYKARALDELFESKYKEDDELFFELTQIFGKRTDDGLTSCIQKLYDLTVTLPDSGSFLRTATSGCNVDMAQNPLAVFINDELCGSANEDYHKLAMHINLCRSHGIEKEAEALADIYKQLTVFDAAKPLPCNIKHLEFMLENKVSLPRFYKKDKTDTEIYVNELSKKYRENIYDNLKKIHSMCPDLKDGELALKLDTVKGHIAKLCELTFSYSDIYKRLKNENALLDFNDLEYYTMEILKNPACREQLKGSYSYIFVDEFQDTNRVQDEIISALCSAGNLFIVGDKKQSIYRFRGADSEIFREKSAQPDYENIILNQNFRSDKGILQFINAVFSFVMKSSFSRTNYLQEGMLSGDKVCAVSDGKPQVIIDVLPAAVHSGEDLPGGIYSVKQHAESLDSCIDDEDYTEEAKLIAYRIKQLVDGKTALCCNEEELEIRRQRGKSEYVDYDDITILTRTKRGFTEGLYRCLQASGIPVAAEFSYNIWQYPEITLLVEFLKLIDNRKQDIPLAAVMKSYFGKFTDGELSAVRIAFREGTFFDAAASYAAEYSDPLSLQLNEFFDRINGYACLSKALPIGKLLLRIISDYDYIPYLETLSGGEDFAYRVNCFLSIIYSGGYADTLPEFLSFLNVAGDSIKLSPKTGPGTDRVHLCTVHSSKGLEYPIVFLAGCGQRFLHMENRDVLQMDRNYGLAMNYFHYESKQTSPLFIKDALKAVLAQEQVREEINILYVAMTRAKYRLHLSGKYNTKGFIPMYGVADIKRASCYFDFLLNDILTLNDSLMFSYADGEVQNCNYEYNEYQDTAFLDEQDKARQSGESFEYFQPLFDYKHIKSTEIPLKNSVSEINRTAFESYGEELPFAQIYGEASGNAESAETGTAYHSVLEHIEFNPDESYISRFIAQLAQNGTISAEQAQTVSPRLLSELFKCEVFSRIESGDRVYREIPFIAETDSENLGYDARENVLLQGVIDLVIIKGDSAVIADYKFSRKGADALKAQYQKQLMLYKQTLEQLLGLPVEACYILQVPLARQIKI